jgi:8-oxo-dGTP diphosphatase
VGLAPIGFVFAMFNNWEKIKKYFFRMAVSINQSGNVNAADFFNWALIDSDGYSFSDEDETISSVIGKNKKRGTLSKCGALLDAILELFDDNHSADSIEQL